MKFGRYTVDITISDKILLPKGITKGDIISYYDAIAHHMLPYIKNRPLTMHRFPEGLAGESFYQKDAPHYFPLWIKTVIVPKKGGYTNYVLCQNRATLVYLANQACITPHVWLSKIDKMHFPDRMIFDLDPSTEDFKLVQLLALALKELLDYLKLKSFVMTTGSRGLHIVVPLDRGLSFKQVKEFADFCARVLKEQYPHIATTEIRKVKRGGRVFIDTLRNQYGATAVAPYAVRAKQGAPVATPIFWDEVETVTPQMYTINNIFKRLDKDPWQNSLKVRQSLKKTIQKLGPYKK